MAKHVSHGVGAGRWARPGLPPTACSQELDGTCAGRAGTGAGPYMRGALQLLVCVGLALAPLAAQSTVDLTSASVIARGSDLFAQNCATGYCHGAEGRAARGPDLRNRDWDPRKLYASIHGGVPGTTMPSWNNIIPDEGIWAVTAYIISLGTTELRGSSASITLGASTAGPAELTGEAKRGHELFFDLNNQKRCAICHRLGGKGTAVGPDLAAGVATKSADDLMNDILQPGASIAEGFEQTVVTSKAGETIAGVKQSETEDWVRVYDSEAIPPPLRTFYRDGIQRTRTRQRSSMPSNYDRIYTREELQAIVAYLKSGNL